jgi:hypothetical protein
MYQLPLLGRYKVIYDPKSICNDRIKYHIFEIRTLSLNKQIQFETISFLFSCSYALFLPFPQYLFKGISVC